MSAPLATLARLLLRASAAASESLDAAAVGAFGLESVVNRCIRESSRAGDLLESLDGKSLAIVVQGLGICLRLGALKTHLAVSVALAHSETAATVTVEGTPLALLRSAEPGGFGESGVRLSGDAQTVEAFAELLRHARPDLEEELSGLIGDIAAHEVAGAARRTDDWARQASSALTMNTSEFLQEEARQLPPRTEVNGFGRDVERLRDDVERAAQRLARLEANRRRETSHGPGTEEAAAPPAMVFRSSTRQPSRRPGADASAERGRAG